MRGFTGRWESGEGRARLSRIVGEWGGCARLSRTVGERSRACKAVPDAVRAATGVRGELKRGTALTGHRRRVHTGSGAAL